MGKFSDVLKECGEYSLPRLIAAICVFTAVLITLMEYLFSVFLGRSWANYTVFITSFLGAGFILPLINKGINSVYNTSPGRIGKPGSKEGDY